MVYLVTGLQVVVMLAIAPVVELVWGLDKWRLRLLQKQGK